MLDELKEFLNIPKIPPKIKIYSTFLKDKKKNYSTKSFKADLRRLSNSKKLSIMDKIIQRRKKEDEAKKREILKNLNKNKKVNLRQFLNRMQNYEQKRKYNLELKKNEQLKQETSFLREKPKINTNSLKLYVNLPKEPLYKRTEEILDERKKVLENLTIFYTLPKEIQNQKNVKRNRYKKPYYSAENTKYDYDDYENTIKSSSIDNFYLRNKKHKKKEKMTKQKSDEFYNKQEAWYKNKKAKEQYCEKLNQKQNLTYSDITFHPYVNQVTFEILDIKNRINTNNDEFYKYNISNNKSQHGELDLNNGRTIHDRLYEESLKKYYNYQDYFLRSINYDDSYNYNYNYNLYLMRKRNKLRSISTQYLPRYNDPENNRFNKNCKYCYQRRINNKIQFKKNNLKVNKSFDDINTIRNINNINDNSNTSINLNKLKNKNKNYIQVKEEEKYKKNEEINNYQWKNSLLSLNPLKGKINDYTYHINVRQKGAWDNNLMNLITLDKNANTRSIINSILFNK